MSLPPSQVKNIKHSFNAVAESGLAELLALESEYPVACDAHPEIRAKLCAFIDASKNR